MSSFDTGDHIQESGRPRGDPSHAADFLDTLHVEIRHGDDGRTRVTVTGEIDYDTAALVQRACDHALDGHDGPLDLDLGGVSFCDCAGLNALLLVRHGALDRGVAMTLSPAGPAVLHLLDLTGARAAFDIADPTPPAQGRITAAGGPPQGNGAVPPPLRHPKRHTS
jgi:anti-anti-sigma factor